MQRFQGCASVTTQRSSEQQGQDNSELRPYYASPVRPLWRGCWSADAEGMDVSSEQAVLPLLP